jgi:hypothetical protein
MPSPLQNPHGWNLRRLISNTYAHKETRTRFVYKQRDMVKGIRIEKISVYDGKSPGEDRTKFIIRTRSTPQYAPFYTKRDTRGRPRKRQMKHHHYYEVTIQLDSLSLDAPPKIRVGGQGRWDMTPAGRDRRVKKGRTFVIIPGTNTVKGLNGDFHWRLENLFKREGVLFGRDTTNGQPPIRVNPHMILFLPKHALAAIELLMNRGYLK